MELSRIGFTGKFVKKNIDKVTYLNYHRYISVYLESGHTIDDSIAIVWK